MDIAKNEMLAETAIPVGEKLREQLESEAARDETFALAADPKPTPTQIVHGPEHIRSRLLIACTAWNSVFGAPKGQALKIHEFINDKWEDLASQMVTDAKEDANNLLSVVWMPTGHMINQLLQSNEKTNQKTYIAITTAGQYLYLKYTDSNFHTPTKVSVPVPANRIILIRETGKDIDALDHTPFIDDETYIGDIPSLTRLIRPRKVIKEADDARHQAKVVAQRRKAKKLASKVKAKKRK